MWIVPALTMIPIMGIIDPRMGIRNAPNPIGEALYGRTRQAVLRLFFGQPDRRFLQKEVSQHIGLGSGTVQRQLERLSESSENTVPVLPILRSMLENYHHYLTGSVEEGNLGKVLKPTDWVFAGERRGTSMNLPNLVRRVITPLLT